MRDFLRRLSFFFQILQFFVKFSVVFPSDLSGWHLSANAVHLSSVLILTHHWELYKMQILMNFRKKCVRIDKCRTLSSV